VGSYATIRRCACRETERRSWDADFKDTPSAQSTPALLWRLRVLRLAPVTSPVSGMPACTPRRSPKAWRLKAACQAADQFADLVFKSNRVLSQQS
jgi:hypothetical protein